MKFKAGKGFAEGIEQIGMINDKREQNLFHHALSVLRRAARAKKGRLRQRIFPALPAVPLPLNKLFWFPTESVVHALFKFAAIKLTQLLIFDLADAPFQHP